MSRDPRLGVLFGARLLTLSTAASTICKIACLVWPADIYSAGPFRRYPAGREGLIHYPHRV
jgi:hypothetical protein